MRNNAVRNTDPTGHLTDDQIERWTGYRIDQLDPEILRMLRAAHLGDALWGYDKNGNLTPYGILWLDPSGHLTFGDTNTYDLLLSGMAGWILTRRIGDTTYLAYHTGGYEYPSDLGEEGLWPLGEGTEEVIDALTHLATTSAVGTAAGVAIEAACKGCSKGIIILATSVAGFAYGVYDLIFHLQPGDRILTYYYEDPNGNIWQQIVVIRDGRVLSYQVFPYSPPWYAQYMK